MDRTNRTEKHKVAESSSKNNKDSPDIITEGGDAIKKEVKLPDGEVGVVLDEVGGDSDSDEGGEKDESGTSPGKAVKGDTHDESMDVETGEGGSAEGKDKSECGEDKEGSTHDHDHDESKGKDRRRSSYDRESSPSSRALLKMYCKYCDVRHVTFRVNIYIMCQILICLVSELYFVIVVCYRSTATISDHFHIFEP